MVYLNNTKLILNAKEVCQRMDLKSERPPPSPGKVIGREEFEEILQHAPDELHELAFRLIYEAGFRPHELLSIRFRYIDIEKVEDSNKDSRQSQIVVVINLPDDNPVTPSGRNKTGGRIIPIYHNAEMLIKICTMRLQETGASRDDRLFPFAHKHFSGVFSAMKKNTPV